ncbi:unnamed protein product [Linum tenue]|uniref:Protein kinase domain-containing protein n=1 Tax=Linum tenue TaxID=586396 RepID=A0AAV0Q9X9_9ROSI|nr:unnamed protein product [Linum tenue]
MVAMLPKTKKKNYQVTFQEVHQQLEYGFELSWQEYSCPHCRRPSHCYPLKFGIFHCNNVALVVAFTRVTGIPLVIIFLIYKWRRRHQSAYYNIEEFLQNQTLMPIREQLYHISLGVAHGIEYLHRGCTMQILHFDIKPHNILLDQSFNPKISNFGLAQLNQPGGDHSIATMTAARGTIGYMAPEMFYKNIGTVSYKADVYSFGMLILEMTGKRRNQNAATDHSSVYFPSWVHNEVSTPGTPIAVGEVTEEEDDIAKKMVIVGLWCIQTNPANRPPMNKVVEMLEGDLESLPLPPKPVLYAGETVTRNEEESSTSSYMSSMCTQSIISTVSK